MDQWYQVNACDLYEEEVSYELAIRQLPVEGSLSTRMRNLRQALREPERQVVRMVIDYSFVDDYPVIMDNLKEIVHRMENNQPRGCWSRLVHYHKRVRRYVLAKPVDVQKQNELLDLINDLSLKYYQQDLNQMISRTELFLVVKSPHGKLPDRTRPDTPAVTPRSVTVAAPANPNPDVPSTSSLSRSSQNVTNQGEDGACGGVPVVSSAVVVTSVGELSSQMSSLRVSSFSTTASTVATTSVTSVQTGAVPKRPVLSDAYEQLRVFLQNPMSNSPVLDTADLSVMLRTPEFHRAFSKAIQSEMSAAESCFRFPAPMTSITALNTSTPTVSSTTTRPTPVLQEVPPTSAHVPVENPGPRRELDMSQYVHIKDIEGYIKACVNSLVHQGPRCPDPHEKTINNLVDQITNVGVHDSEVTNISRGVVPGLPIDLNLPLQLTAPTSQTPLGGGYAPLSLLSNATAAVSQAPSFEIPATPQFRLGTRETDPRRQTPPLQPHPQPPVDPFYENGPNPSNPYSGQNPLARSTALSQPSGGYQHPYVRPRLPHQTCNIIEKWPKFSGDTSPIPVDDFLRQIEQHSRSYQISAAELRVHAHLLFKDDAYVWFCAYDEKLNTWELLVSYLRMRYDNPNRDRYIRDEMKARKQRPNEKFSAYLTDMEAMSQRLVKKMTLQEKFDIIVENMKMSYQRRLALHTIHSIEHLALLCYKFDSLEGNLYNRTNPKSAGVNQIEIEDELAEEVEDSEESQVFAVQVRKTPSAVRSSNEAVPVSRSRDDDLCWNCRKIGHMWRECVQRKRLFCHICGQENTIASQCPNQHNLRASKND